MNSRKLANQELSALLITTNLSKGDSTGLVSVRLLDTAGGGRCRLAGCFGRKLFARSFTAGGLACCLSIQDMLAS